MPYYDGVPVCNLGLEQGALQEQAWSQKVHGERYVDRWSKVKEMAIQQIKSRSGSGPTVLKTVMLDHCRMPETYFHPAMGMEDISCRLGSERVQANCSARASTYVRWFETSGI